MVGTETLAVSYGHPPPRARGLWSRGPLSVKRNYGRPGTGQSAWSGPERSHCRGKTAICFCHLSAPAQVRRRPGIVNRELSEQEMPSIASRLLSSLHSIAEGSADLTSPETRCAGRHAAFPTWMSTPSLCRRRTGRCFRRSSSGMPECFDPGSSCSTPFVNMCQIAASVASCTTTATIASFASPATCR